jgi:hypothetical protein
MGCMSFWSDDDDDVNTRKKSKEALSKASREAGLEVNTEKTICFCLIIELHNRIII